MAELVDKQLPTTSIAGTIRTIHQQILAAHNEQSQELTAKELDRIALKICVECGIKDAGIPSEEMVDLCLKSWEEKFKGKMNKHELLLAFEMNVNGDLEVKVNHYQCFSREFFCDVLNLYLKKKLEVISREQKKPSDSLALKALDITRSVMEDLINDREIVKKGELSNRNSLTAKLEMLYELFDFPVTDEQISNYRGIVTTDILTRLSKERAEARVNEKFGREIELANQIDRFKSKKLLTEKDEELIQYEVSKLLYCNTLLLWTEQEFIAHVNLNIECLNK